MGFGLRASGFLNPEPKTKPLPHTLCSPGVAQEANEEEDEEESSSDHEMQDDVVPEAEADLDTPQPAVDLNKEPTEEDLAKAAELKPKVPTPSTKLYLNTDH